MSLIIKINCQLCPIKAAIVCEKSRGVSAGHNIIGTIQGLIEIKNISYGNITPKATVNTIAFIDNTEFACYTASFYRVIGLIVVKCVKPKYKVFVSRIYIYQIIR